MLTAFPLHTGGDHGGAFFLIMVQNGAVTFARKTITKKWKGTHEKPWQRLTWYLSLILSHYRFTPREMNPTAVVIFQCWTPWASWGWAASRHSSAHPVCSVADLQTDVLLSTSASPKIHKLILAQTDTSVCVGLREEESARCLKSLQQAIPSAWAQLGGIPNTSVQSQHLIVFPRRLRCNTCFAAVERQESAPETNTVPPETSTLGSARTAGSSCTRILSKLKQWREAQLHQYKSFLSSSTTSEQHRDASQHLTSPSTPGRRGFIPTTQAKKQTKNSQPPETSGFGQ